LLFVKVAAGAFEIAVQFDQNDRELDSSSVERLSGCGCCCTITEF